MDIGCIPDDGATSALEFTDDPVTEASEVSTPVTFSADASPLLSEQPLPSETTTAVPKKKKKKKSKKSNKGKDTVRADTPNVRSSGDKTDSPQVLCISRNKHWRYISSYHGPWLQYPAEILESLLQVDVDPATHAAPSLSPYLQSTSPTSPSSRIRFQNFEDYSPPGSPRGAVSSIGISPSTGKPLPPPLDPGVLRSVAKIRRLIDEATDLSVRASSGLSAIELGQMRNTSSYNGTTWAAAQSLGLNPPGTSTGGGRNPGMSANRVHRLRAIAVQKLAQAYKIDEIASSVMVMQGGSVFDDLAERVLKHDPLDPDAKYVHFFHEKIPSSHRQLAESTPTTILDELISQFPHQLEYYRTRGIVHTFHENFTLAIKDFAHALKEARARRKRMKSHHSDSRGSTKSKKRRGTGGGNTHTNGQAPSDGTSVPEGTAEWSEGDLSLHPSMQPDAPEPLENQLLFLRGAAYLQQAVHMIESAIIELEGVQKPKGLDGADLRLCCLSNARYGGVEIGNSDGPLGSRTGPKMKAYREVLGAEPFREQVNSLLKKSIRDHEKFLSHFHGGESALLIPDNDIVYRVEYAFNYSEAARPGNHNNQAPMNNQSLTAYHPLLIESHFSVLISYLMLGDFDSLIHQFARTNIVADGGQGYPIFLPPRSMGQAEFIEVLERLATGWKNGCQPHSRVGNHRGKARLTDDAPTNLPKLITPSISTSSINSTTSTISTISALPLTSPIPTPSATFLTQTISGMNLNTNPGSSSNYPTWTIGSSSGGSMTRTSSNTSSPFIDPTTESNLGSSSSSSLLHPDATPAIEKTYAPSTSSTSVSRKSSSHTLNTPSFAPSPSCSPSPLQQPAPSNEEKFKKLDDNDQEFYRVDASHALDCARILLAPVIKRQRTRAEQSVAERVTGLKSAIPINIPMHGPRVEIILAWIGAFHLPALDGA